MNKETTIAIKGIAILLMLFLHLFNGDNSYSLHNMFYIDDKPLSLILTRAANPVHFFLILGGYGLYCNYIKGQDNNRYKRIYKLFRNYWIVLFFGVVCAYAFKGIRFWDRSIFDIFVNVTALHTTWNGTCWFLFPYALLSVSYPIIFRFFGKFKSWQILIVAYLLYYMATFCRSIYSEMVLTNNVNPLFTYSQLFVLYFEMSFPFIIGAILKRERIVERIKGLKFYYNKNLICFLLLLILVI